MSDGQAGLPDQHQKQKIRIIIMIIKNETVRVRRKQMFAEKQYVHHSSHMKSSLKWLSVVNLARTFSMMQFICAQYLCTKNDDD